MGFEPRKLVGTVVADKYKLVRLIGGGAMGTVFEGEHLPLGRRVAVKILQPGSNAVGDMAERFRREALVMSRVNSDYIVQIFDVGEDTKVGLYMILELLHGEDLERRLAREKRIDIPTVCMLGYQMARGMAKAHAVGIIHRDLKPANIFLTVRDDGSMLTKVLDFGVSKLREAGVHAPFDDITRPGVALGTPQYMSPEQVEARDSLDARSDVWSLSAVLFEAISGRPPFTGNTSLDVMSAVYRDPIPSLRAAAPWVPQVLADVIMSGLVRDRDYRMPSAELFAEALLDAVPEYTELARAQGSLSPFRAPILPTSGVMPVSNAPAPQPTIGDTEESKFEFPAGGTGGHQGGAVAREAMESLSLEVDVDFDVDEEPRRVGQGVNR
jgi:serine/threonine-protein kinase